jgi:hypothetical protein
MMNTQNSKPKIWADFGKPGSADGPPHYLFLTTLGTANDLRRLGLELYEGFEAIFYDNDVDDAGRPIDVEVDGRVHFLADRNIWVAVVDFTKARRIHPHGS